MLSNSPYAMVYFWQRWQFKTASYNFCKPVNGLNKDETTSSEVSYCLLALGFEPKASGYITSVSGLSAK